MNINFENQVTLNNEVNMPWVGLGVFRVEDHAELVEAIKLAIVQGYRSIDTASLISPIFLKVNTCNFTI